ncbi:MAG: peptide/lipid/heavy metal/multidrug exporter [Chloroflexi bacterium]|nr:MAG: peptide/lipid/heavy metal/multidrug exporter [Chloroflexota bacterium]MBA4375403.1 ABC transporter [Anaerolinea sp.]
MHGHGMRRLANSPDEIPHVSWALIKRVMRYAKPYNLMLVLMLILILTGTGLSLLTPLIVREMIDNTIPTHDLSRLVLLALCLFVIPGVNGVLNVIQRRMSADVGEGVIYDLRMALYSGLQRMSLRFFTNTKVGELMSRLNNDVVGAQNAISRTLVDLVTNFIQVLATIGVMFSLEWRLTLISVAVVPLFIFAVRKLSNRLRDIVRGQMEANAHMNAMMHETLNIGGALLVKLFGRSQIEVDRFGSRAKQVKKQGVERAFVGSIFMAIIGLVSAVGTALVYGFGGYFAITGAFTVGLIVAFGSYLGSLYGALFSLANAPVDFAASVVSFERVFEVIDLPLDIEENEEPVSLNEVKGEIIFDDVTFTYQTGDEPFLSDVHRYGSMESITTVMSGEANGGSAEETHHSQARGNALEHVSFSVEPGRLVALVGPSGAGKTTLTYLIPRLYDPTSGSIRIDGHDLRDVTLESLSAQIGMVTQENYLFHDTIRTNLLYSKLDATQSDLEEACKAANIHNFIADLPDGYDTVVGERGYRLSGGEKQRIALARVILKDPRILVLDEATSSLDSESEALIQEALKRVMAKRTSIVIAHRLSTILAADLILVIDRGQVVERGTHKELLVLKGLYAQLYKTQFSKREAGSEGSELS